MATHKKTDDNSVTVAIDAMGGDYAPSEIVRGAIEAAQLYNTNIILVGDKTELDAEIQRYDLERLPINLVYSEGKIVEDEHPVQAFRSKPKSSIVVTTKLVKEGYADAMVSMGSTGASMACATLILGTLEGLERPCIGGPFLGLSPQTIAIDLGSNVDCRPPLLAGFAAMGCVFAKLLLNIEDPKVGLLSTGAEESKGNRQTQETHQIFKDSRLNFVGNVEGMDFFTGKADVIVCDGFVGNVLMKFSEGLGSAVSKYIRRELEELCSREQVDILVSKIRDVNNLPQRMGGPIFGVNGTVVVGHGASDSKGVIGAIETAIRCVNLDLVRGFEIGLQSLFSTMASE